MCILFRFNQLGIWYKKLLRTEVLRGVLPLVGCNGGRGVVATFNCPTAQEQLRVTACCCKEATAYSQTDNSEIYSSEQRFNFHHRSRNIILLFTKCCYQCLNTSFWVNSGSLSLNRIWKKNRCFFGIKKSMKIQQVRLVASRARAREELGNHIFTFSLLITWNVQCRVASWFTPDCSAFTKIKTTLHFLFCLPYRELISENSKRHALEIHLRNNNPPKKISRPIRFLVVFFSLVARVPVSARWLTEEHFCEIP